MLYRLNDVLYDAEFGEFRRDGETHKLSAMGMKVLNFFLAHREELITYDRLMSQVWRKIVSENAVVQIITHIRQTHRALDADIELITNIRGKGFLLNPELHVSSAGSAAKPSARPAWLMPLLAALVILVAAVVMVASVFERQDSDAQSAVAARAAQRVLIVPAESEHTGQPLDAALMLATSQFIENVLISDENRDVVNTDAYSEPEHMRRFAHSLWQSNPNMTLITTRYRQDNDVHALQLDVVSGDALAESRVFNGVNLRSVLLQATEWIGQRQGGAHTARALPDLLPDDAYLVETYLRGIAAAKLGENARAIDYFELCLKEKNDFHLARLALAKALRRHSEYDRTWAQLELLLSLDEMARFRNVVRQEMAAIQLIRGQLHEARATYLSILQATPDALKQIPVQLNLALVETRLGDIGAAQARLEALAAHINPETHPEYAAFLHTQQANLSIDAQQFTAADEHLQAAMALFVQLGDVQRQGMMLGKLAHLYMGQGLLRSGAAYAEERLAIARDLDSKRDVMNAMDALVKLHFLTGELDLAAEYNAELEHLALALSSTTGRIHAASWHTQIALDREQLQTMRNHLAQYTRLSQSSGNRSSIRQSQVLAFALAVHSGDRQTATTLWPDIYAAIDAGSPTVRAVTHLYEYHAMMQQMDAARRMLLRVLESVPENEQPVLEHRVRLLLAESHLASDAQRSLDLLDEFQTDEVNACRYHRLRAQALHTLQRPVEALESLETARPLCHQRWNSDWQALHTTLRQAVNQ